MGSRTHLLAPLTGLMAIGLIAVSAITFGYFEYLPDPGDVTRHFTENPLAVQVAGYLGLLGTFFLFWFGSSLRAGLRVAEGGDGRVANIAFGGMVGAAAILVVAYSLMFSTGVRAGSSGGIDQGSATFAYDAYTTVVGSGAALALGVAIGAYAVVAFRTRMVGRWLAWASAMIALGSVSPLAYLFVGLAAAWLAYVSVSLYLAGRREAVRTRR